MKRLAVMMIAVMLLIGLTVYAEEMPVIDEEASVESAETEKADSSEEIQEVPKEQETEVLLSTKEPVATIVPTAVITPKPTHSSAPTKVPEPTRVPEPIVRFSRDFSTQYAEAGDEVTLSYTVRNDSALPIKNIVVKDGLLGEVGRISRLGAGERKTISTRLVMEKTCVSTPSLSYEYNAKAYSKQLSEGEIRQAHVKVAVTLESDKDNVAPGELVTLRLRVVNEGDVNLYGLRAKESMLGEMGSLVSVLEPGNEFVVTRTVPMKSGATFQFHVTGSSDTGAEFKVESNKMSVLVTPVAAQIRLTLRVETDQTELYAPGEVAFRLYLDNECSLELRNVLLSETMRGEIRNLEFVPAGKMPPITQSYLVSESGTYQFMAQVSDSVGDRTTVYSEPLFIRVSEDGEKIGEATEEPFLQEQNTREPMIPLLGGQPYRMADDTATFEKLMIGTAVLLMLILMSWYAVARIRKEKKRRRRRRKKKNKNKKNKQPKSGKARD